MERTKKPNINEETGEVRWKKIGGGSLRMPNRIIKPGEIFWAKPEDIPAGFRDVIIPLDGDPATKPKPEPKGIQASYSIQPRPKGAWVDIVDAQGKKVNEKALSREAAEEMIKELTK